jgi:hypothetical protein
MRRGAQQITKSTTTATSILITCSGPHNNMQFNCKLSRLFHNFNVKPYYCVFRSVAWSGGLQICANVEEIVWDFKLSRRRVWCSELFSGMYCRVRNCFTVCGIYFLSIFKSCEPEYKLLLECLWWWYFIDYDHVNTIRLCLWTAATNGPIVHPPGDIWAWRTIL